MLQQQVASPHDAVTFIPAPVSSVTHSDGSIRLRTELSFEPDVVLIHEHLKQWASIRPDKVFLAERVEGVAGWRTITYAAAFQQAARLAAALASRDLDEDRPILILSGNGIDHQIMALAAMIAAVPYTPLSVAYSTMSGDFAKLRDVLKTLQPGLVFAAEGTPFSRALSIPEMAGRDIVVGRDTAGIPNALTLDQLAETAGELEARIQPAAGPDTVAKILFTSGSTGSPKGVPTTHRMMSTSLCQFEALWPFLLHQTPTLLDWLPWSHVFGGSYSVNTVLRYGGTLYIDDGKPVPSEIGRTVRNLQEVRPTLYWNVPKGFELLLAHLHKDSVAADNFFGDLTLMLYAGASLPAPLWKELVDLGKRACGRVIPMTTSWGLTETAPSITLVNNPALTPGDIGIPMPGLEIKLVPYQGKMEARVRGPTVMTAYWKMPEATAAAFDDEGFFRTGDAVVFSDPKDPSLGLVFDGRTTEDFKLLTGTWVDTAAVKLRANIALAGIAADVVVTGADQNEIGLLVIAPLGVDPASAELLAATRSALRRVNDGATGASQRIARAIILHDRPTFDAGEITEKGSLNMRLIRDRRRDVIAKLYSGADSDVIVID
jgi:feruloyl-CoA synthase